MNIFRIVTRNVEDFHKVLSLVGTTHFASTRVITCDEVNGEISEVETSLTKKDIITNNLPIPCSNTCYIQVGGIDSEYGTVLLQL